MDIAFKTSRTARPMSLTPKQRIIYERLIDGHRLAGTVLPHELDRYQDKPARGLVHHGLITRKIERGYVVVQLIVIEFTVKMFVRYSHEFTDVCRLYRAYAPDLYTAVIVAQKMFGTLLRGVEHANISIEDEKN